MKRKILILVVFAASLMNGPAQADIIDINLRTGPNPYGAEYSRYKGYGGPSLSTMGYFFSTNIYDYDVFTNWIDIARDRGSDFLKYNANKYNPMLSMTYRDTILTIRKDDASSFSFNGVSFADSRNSDLGGIIDVTFQNRKDGSSYTQSVTLDKVSGLQSFSFSPNNVTEIFIKSKTLQTGAFQLDFVDVGNAFISSVPEPSTWALMLIGFGIVGYAARRTRRPTMRMQVV